MRIALLAAQISVARHGLGMPFTKLLPDKAPPVASAGLHSLGRVLVDLHHRLLENNSISRKARVP